MTLEEARRAFAAASSAHELADRSVRTEREVRAAAMSLLAAAREADASDDGR